ncbi:Proline/betaine transporter [compost metagenome]
MLLNCLIGVMASTLPAMFPTRVRYSALATAFNISVIVCGLTPTAAAWLVEATGDLMMPAYYLMVVAVVGLATAMLMRETANRPLRGDTPNASSRREARELLQEAYDHIEASVDDLDAKIDGLQSRITDLQQRKQALVDRHPDLV